MPPKKGKKGDKKQQAVHLGRPGNNVGMGIVGMPNVGKSTLFNCLSKLNVAAENYPFCTIDPSVARVPVPDKRFDHLVKAWKPKSVVSAVLEITDIAGLVSGASEGKGLGNAFLSHIQAVDAIYHVTRAFSSKKIEHVEGNVDPVRDMEIISNELILKDLARIKGKHEAVSKIVNRNLDKTKKADKDLITLDKAIAMLEEKKDLREGKWTPADVDVLNEMQLLSAKPVVYLINISKKDFLGKKNKWFKKIHDWCTLRSPGAPIIPFCASFETSLVSMEDEERAKYLAETKMESMLTKIITTGYHALHLVHFFTCGADEVRAWTIKEGCSAPNAAGVIHGDFERCFISADQYAFDDFVECGDDEQAVAKAGKKRTRGRVYTVLDGDILFFKHNAGGAKKKK